MSVERMLIRNSDDLIPCPYDKSHMIREKRMVYHLRACRANNPAIELVPCSFNAKHLIPPKELRYHMAHCDDRVRLESDILYEKQDIAKGYTDVPEYNQVIVVPSKEDWDSEVDALKDRIQLNEDVPTVSIDAVSKSKKPRISALNFILSTSRGAVSNSDSDRSSETNLPQTKPAGQARVMGGVKMPLAGVGRGSLIDNNHASGDKQRTAIPHIGRGRALRPR